MGHVNLPQISSHCLEQFFFMWAITFRLIGFLRVIDVESNYFVPPVYTGISERRSVDMNVNCYLSFLLNCVHLIWILCCNPTHVLVRFYCCYYYLHNQACSINIPMYFSNDMIYTEAALLETFFRNAFFYLALYHVTHTDTTVSTQKPLLSLSFN